VNSMAARSLRVFLDSNVIISGLLSDRGAPRIILDILTLSLPGIVGMTGEYNILEIERNLGRKLPRAIPVWREYQPSLGLEIVPLPLPNEIERYRGITVAKDVPVLVSALNGRADVLVTGDMKDFGHFDDGDFPFLILAPALFLDHCRKFLAEQ